MEYFLEVICNHGESGPFATTTARTSGFQTEGPSDKLFSYVLHAIYKHCCIYIYIFFLDALEIVFRVSKSCPSMSANQSHLDQQWLGCIPRHYIHQSPCPAPQAHSRGSR